MDKLNFAASADGVIRPLAPDWFVVFTYGLVAAVGALQILILIWMDVF